MTDAGWAERKVNSKPMAVGCQSISAQAAITLIKAEHRRAVRVVEREIRKLEAIKVRSFCNAEIAEAYASITVLRDILAALQRGRE